MQLAIDEDRRVQEPSEGLEMRARAEARSARVTTGRVGITSGGLIVTREVPK